MLFNKILAIIMMIGLSALVAYNIFRVSRALFRFIAYKDVKQIVKYSLLLLFLICGAIGFAFILILGSDIKSYLEFKSDIFRMLIYIFLLAGWLFVLITVISIIFKETKAIIFNIKGKDYKSMCINLGIMIIGTLCGLLILRPCTLIPRFIEILFN